MKKNLNEKIDEQIKFVNENIEKSKEQLELLNEMKIFLDENKSKKVLLRDFDENFYLKNENCNIHIQRNNGNWILKSGSETNAYLYWNKHGGENMPYARFYQKHINNIDSITGVVIEDIYDSSISNLVAISHGKPSASGWTQVKTIEGKTPDDCYRK